MARGADGQDWAEARRLVALARDEIKAAGALAGDLGDAVKARDAVAGASDAAKLKAAAEVLRKEADAVTAKEAAAEIGAVRTAIDMALAQSEAGKHGEAQTALAGAAEKLIAARTEMAEQARYAARAEALKQRAAALTGSTEPPAAQLAGLVKPVTDGQAAAAKAAAAKDWTGAGESLSSAERAAAEAERFAPLRKAFNTEVARVEAAAGALAPALRASVEKMVAKAKASVNGFDANYAMRYLENADAQMAGADVERLAGTDPADPAFLAAVKKMLAAKGGDELAKATPYVKGGTLGATASSGTTRRERGGEANPVTARQAKTEKSGPELLDAIVAQLGRAVADRVSGETPEEAMKRREANMKVTQAIAIVARERFGIDLSISAIGMNAGKRVEKAPGVEGADFATLEAVTVRDTKRAKSAGRIYEMLALTPQAAMKNPSMLKVMREDAFKKKADGSVSSKTASGGYYSSGRNLAVISGRPGDAGVVQQFGSKLGQLPALDDPVYAPVDEAGVDYFDFATVHEVGHAVDDRMGFMASRAKNAAFGNWTTYGSGVGPIVAAVQKHAMAGNGGADSAVVRRYVEDIMSGGLQDLPQVAADEQAATDAACSKARDWYKIATNEKVWWKQDQVDAITLDGIVYQEAYKNSWVSYPAAERKKGITGYQFRAPGEWFAELFAAYHLGKLKNGHPARQWLSTLSL